MSLFLVITFLFCIALGLVSTRAELHNAWFALLPGVTWLSWTSVMNGIEMTPASRDSRSKRRVSSAVRLAVLAPLFLSACMLPGVGGMGMHGGGMQEPSPGSAMRGPATIKEVVAQGIRITATFPAYAVGDAPAYDVSLRDLRDGTLIRDASLFLSVTPAGAIKAAPAMSDSGSFVFRPALPNEGTYRLVVTVERIGTTALAPPIQVEHTVQVQQPMRSRAADDHGSGGFGTTPLVLLGAAAMAVMMLFAFR